MTTPLHTRGEIGLRPPRSEYSRINGEGSTGHYGGTDPATWPWDHTRCASIWRAWQSFHMDGRGWNDIAYTGGVCPHGHRYEGRPPWARTAAQGTNDGNARSTAVCYIGGVRTPFTDEAKLAFLDEQQRVGELRWCHRDWHSTACPGDQICRWIKAGKPTPADAGAPMYQPIIVPPRPIVVVGREDDLRLVDIDVLLDGNGNGWRAANRPHRKLVSVVQGANDVPGGAPYGFPGQVGAARHVDDNTIIVVTGGWPGGRQMVRAAFID